MSLTKGTIPSPIMRLTEEGHTLAERCERMVLLSDQDPSTEEDFCRIIAELQSPLQWGLEDIDPLPASFTLDQLKKAWIDWTYDVSHLEETISVLLVLSLLEEVTEEVTEEVAGNLGGGGDKRRAIQKKEEVEKDNILSAQKNLASAEEALKARVQKVEVWAEDFKRWEAEIGEREEGLKGFREVIEERLKEEAKERALWEAEKRKNEGEKRSIEEDKKNIEIKRREVKILMEEIEKRAF